MRRPTLRTGAHETRTEPADTTSQCEEALGPNGTLTWTYANRNDRKRMVQRVRVDLPALRVRQIGRPGWCRCRRSATWRGGRVQPETSETKDCSSADRLTWLLPVGCSAGAFADAVDDGFEGGWEGVGVDAHEDVGAVAQDVGGGAEFADVVGVGDHVGGGGVA